MGHLQVQEQPQKAAHMFRFMLGPLYEHAVLVKPSSHMSLHGLHAQSQEAATSSAFFKLCLPKFDLGKGAVIAGAAAAVVSMGFGVCGLDAVLVQGDFGGRISVP